VRGDLHLTAPPWMMGAGTGSTPGKTEE